MLKALVAQINYSIFDVEVTQQQNQFAYLEGKDLTDTIDGVLKLHDKALWSGTDTDLVVPQTNQYVGISGQIVRGTEYNGISNKFEHTYNPPTTSIVDSLKTAVATMAAREDFEVRPTAIYQNPLTGDLIDQEAKALQMWFNETEIIPGVIVKALPTQIGLLPMIGDAGLNNLTVSGAVKRYSSIIVQEDAIEYHWLTSPVPRVFQLGLLQNLAAQFVVVKFGAPVAKGAGYAHGIVSFTK